jgi:hypothetical protein
MMRILTDVELDAVAAAGTQDSIASASECPIIGIGTTGDSNTGVNIAHVGVLCGPIEISTSEDQLSVAGNISFV